MFNNLPDILTVNQVAEALGIGKKAAYNLLKNDVIGHLVVGRTYKIPKECLVEYVKTARYKVKL